MPFILPGLMLAFMILAGTGFVKGQGEVCIPQTWVGKKVKGMIFIYNGDSIAGKFIHLTPRNDYHTTHIIFKDSNGKNKMVNRANITAYFNNKEKAMRYKVYPNTDSVFVKKRCHFDMGVFMLTLVDGPYKLLKDVLTNTSSIQAYNESELDVIYYILPPDNKLLKLNRNDLKPQLKSLFSGYPGVDQIFSEPGFNMESVSKIISLVNASISGD